MAAECTRPVRATVGQVESALADVLALLDHHLLDLGGTYGDPEAGEPIQYDELRIEHDQGEVEIVVYNRAILLFFTESEAVRRIHQVCCRCDNRNRCAACGEALHRFRLNANFYDVRADAVVHVPGFLGLTHQCAG